MRVSHRQAQDLFLALGNHRGFSVRRQYSKSYPTDGVWLTSLGREEGVEVPVAAIEVVCSESPKTILGSVATLITVSPSTGIVLLHEEEISRRMVRDGASRRDVVDYLARSAQRIDAEIATTKQRIERWSFACLAWRCRHLAPSKLNSASPFAAPVIA
jgi:hypothetical protein